MKVDVVASQDHWLDHLGPVATELKARSMLGTTYIDNEVSDAAIEKWSDLKLRRIDVRDKPQVRPTLVASIMDLRQAQARSRAVILMEHGAGQSYSDSNPSYAGGAGRERCLLVLAPNAMAARRHDGRYHGAPPVEVIGSPRVDALVERFCRPSFDLDDQVPTVAISFNWGCRMWPEAGSVWPHYGPAALTQLAAMREAGFINVMGHAHPRIADDINPPIVDQVREACERLEIGFCETFDDVCAVADVYCIDNSSTLFEFAALDRPVVVMDSPAYRKRVNHGLRFWAYADIGPRIGSAINLPAAVSTAIADPSPFPNRRMDFAKQIFGPLDGKAAHRAVDAIEKRLHG